MHAYGSYVQKYNHNYLDDTVNHIIIMDKTLTLTNYVFVCLTLGCHEQ